MDLDRVFLAVFAVTAEVCPGLESLVGTQPTLDDTDGPAFQVGLSGLEQQQLPRGQCLRNDFQVFGDLRIWLCAPLR